MRAVCLLCETNFKKQDISIQIIICQGTDSRPKFKEFIQDYNVDSTNFSGRIKLYLCYSDPLALTWNMMSSTHIIYTIVYLHNRVSLECLNLHENLTLVQKLHPHEKLRFLKKELLLKKLIPMLPIEILSKISLKFVCVWHSLIYLHNNEYNSLLILLMYFKMNSQLMNISLH